MNRDGRKADQSLPSQHFSPRNGLLLETGVWRETQKDMESFADEVRDISRAWSVIRCSVLGDDDEASIQ